jgi:hypothetical protein
VKYVGYFETIQSDFQRICKHIDINALLAHTNKGTERDYRGDFDEETRQIVGAVYADDITRFGYDFDSIVRRVSD